MILTAVHEVVLPLPPSVNDYWFVTPQGGMAPTKAAKEYKLAVVTEFSQRPPLVGRVEIERLHIFPRDARSDIDGFLKCLFDALEGILWLNDRQIRRVEDWEIFTPRLDAHIRLRVRGELFATREQVDEWRAKRAATAKKRKATLAAKRAERAPDRVEAANSDWKRLAKPASYPRKA